MVPLHATSPLDVANSNPGPLTSTCKHSLNTYHRNMTGSLNPASRNEPVCFLIPLSPFYVWWPNTSTPTYSQIELPADLLQLLAAFFSSEIQTSPFLRTYISIGLGVSPSGLSAWVRLNMILFISSVWKQSVQHTELKDALSA